MSNILYRSLSPHDLSLIREIDRSEEIFSLYRLKNGKLELEPHRETVTHWDEKELDQLVQHQHEILQKHGVVTGAFHQQKLVGVASVENVQRGIESAYFKLDILYVSNAYRGHRIGKYLLLFSKNLAKRFGADKLYISATPTKNTVDFYMKHGAAITQEVDPVLLQQEPDDIHLELKV